jgi:hypothetical protein
LVAANLLRVQPPVRKRLQDEKKAGIIIALFSMKSLLNVHFQFPLRLASCITTNKSQGQEYDAVLYDTVRPSFSHGHTYVALSRVKQHDTIALFVSEETIGANAASISNFVYGDWPKQNSCSMSHFS